MATSVPIAPSLQIGERLAKERLRLGLTQSEFSGVIGLSRNSVTQYEAGNHQPGAEALVGVHAAGADVLYILTGLRAESRKIDFDLDRMAIALQEARRQMALAADTVGQRAQRELGGRPQGVNPSEITSSLKQIENWTFASVPISIMVCQLNFQMQYAGIGSAEAIPQIGRAHV